MSDKKISAEMTIHEAIKLNPAAAQVLMSVGMHCLGCAMARGETVEEAANVHHQDVNELIERMNAAE